MRAASPAYNLALRFSTWVDGMGGRQRTTLFMVKEEESKGKGGKKKK